MVDLVQGDYGKNLNFTVTDDNGIALDLTDNTAITFKMTIKNATDDDTTITAECTVTVAEEGTCFYTLADGNTDVIGTYDYEIEVTYDGIIATAPGSETIIIKPQITIPVEE